MVAGELPNDGDVQSFNPFSGNEKAVAIQQAIGEAHSRHESRSCDRFEPTGATVDGDEIIACEECGAVLLRWSP